LANIMTSDFLAMSLFIAEKPIGIIYADRSQSTTPIDENTFLQPDSVTLQYCWSIY